MLLKQFITIVCLLFVAISLNAQVPNRINYQGRLNDASGSPVADGDYLVKFIIYDAAVGGVDIWNTGYQAVTTVGGLFTYELGSNMALPANIFDDTSRYLGITVGVDAELSPRSRLQTAPYAYHALKADTALYSESSTGVSQIFGTTNLVYTGYLTPLGFDSIYCPTDGYVMVNVTMDMACIHTIGDYDAVFVVIMDSTLTVGSDQDNRSWIIPTVSPTAIYANLIHIHKVFPVSAGWNEYNAIASQSTGGGTDNFIPADLTMSLLFIPQALGTVSVSTATPLDSKFNLVPIKTTNIK